MSTAEGTTPDQVNEERVWVVSLDSDYRPELPEERIAWTSPIDWFKSTLAQTLQRLGQPSDAIEVTAELRAASAVHISCTPELAATVKDIVRTIPGVNDIGDGDELWGTPT